MKNQLNATVKNINFVNDNLFILQVKPDFEIPDFSPGQYVALGLLPKEAKEGDSSKKNRLIRRTYSIASSPSNKDYLEFFIALVKDGELSPKLAQLKPQDRIFVMPKIAGAFTLESITEVENIFLFATGTGVAPYMSMLRDGNIFTLSNNIYLIYGVRYESDFAYVAELEDFTKHHSNFKWYATVSRPSENWKGRKGYVQQFVYDGTLNVNVNGDHIFLCGNPGMVDELKDYFLNKGFSLHTRRESGNLHLEAYW